MLSNPPNMDPRKSYINLGKIALIIGIILMKVGSNTNNLFLRALLFSLQALQM